MHGKFMSQTYCQLKELLRKARTEGKLEGRPPLFCREIRLTLAKFETMVNANQGNKDDSEVIDDAFKQQLKDELLTKRWERIIGTDLEYTQDSQNPASVLCIGLAKFLNQNPNQPNGANYNHKESDTLQLLMPTLVDYTPKNGQKSLNEHDIADFVLSDSGKEIIPVKQCVDNYLATSKWESDCSLRQAFGSAKSTIEKRQLSPTEKARVKKHTPKINGYLQACREEAIIPNILTMLDLLNFICSELGKSSSNEKKAGDVKNQDANPQYLAQARAGIWLLRYILPYNAQRNLLSLLNENTSYHLNINLANLFQIIMREGNYKNTTNVVDLCTDCLSCDLARIIAKHNATFQQMKLRQKENWRMDIKYVSSSSTDGKQTETASELCEEVPYLNLQDELAGTIKIDDLMAKVGEQKAKEEREGEYNASIEDIRRHGKYAPCYGNLHDKTILDGIKNDFSEEIANELFLFSTNDPSVTEVMIDALVATNILTSDSKNWLSQARAGVPPKQLIESLITENKLDYRILFSLICKFAKSYKFTKDVALRLFITFANKYTLSYQVRLFDFIKKLVADGTLQQNNYEFFVSLGKELLENRLNLTELVTQLQNNGILNDEQIKALIDKLAENPKLLARLAPLTQRRNTILTCKNFALSIIKLVDNGSLTTLNFDDDNSLYKLLFIVSGTNNCIDNCKKIIEAIIENAGTNTEQHPKLAGHLLLLVGKLVTDCKLPASFLCDCVKKVAGNKIKNLCSHLRGSTKTWRFVFISIAVVLISLFSLSALLLGAAAFTFFGLSLGGIVFSATAFPVATYVCLCVGIAAVLALFAIGASLIFFPSVRGIKSAVDGKACVKLYTRDENNNLVILSHKMNAKELRSIVTKAKRGAHYNTDNIIWDTSGTKMQQLHKLFEKQHFCDNANEGNVEALKSYSTQNNLLLFKDEIGDAKVVANNLYAPASLYGGELEIFDYEKLGGFTTAY